ncbi:MAG TPA: TonB-dependent receptor [Candidatus Baltobacteraceae bacterium]|jgi:hypothetical protein|nr:TonB-dependent receptor [Candidatus Baltobacteraceae bacterium]
MKLRNGLPIRPRAVAVLIALLVCSILAPPLRVYAADTGTISGTVLNNDGEPVSGAGVLLQGPTAQNTATDAKGTFRFAAVPIGVYAVVVNKPGFSPYRADDVVVLAGNADTVNVTLAPLSFSSLRTIASVSTRVPGRAHINESTASINEISSQTFVDQGQLQVTKVLNEVPGIIAFSGQTNGASQLTAAVPQIRGGMGYETESLIDGHPVSVGSSGYFSPTLINPALLQDVELVKGPGSMPTEINYAIGGTVNYRTLEPTRTPHQEVSFGVDGYGGFFGDAIATGSTTNHRFDYAVGYATDITPGPLRNYPINGSQVPLLYGNPPWTINGQQVATVPLGVGPPPAYAVPYSGIVGAEQFQQPMYLCCEPVNTAYNSKSELAKLRVNFSQQTALTVSYLGGQAYGDYLGSTLVDLTPVGTVGNGSFSIFAPPAGYTGSVPGGSKINFDTSSNNLGNQWLQQNLFQGEVRTSAGPYTFLGRYYSGYVASYLVGGSQAPLTFTENAWGGIPLCPTGTSFDLTGYFTTGVANCLQSNGSTVSPTMTFFNGQRTKFQTGSAFASFLNQDHLRGESLEADRTIANDDYSVSVDRNIQTSLYYEDNPFAGIVGYQLPPSSSLKFTTGRARARLAFNPKFSLTLSYYWIQYNSHFSGDGGATWHDSTHTFNTPRLAFLWRPNVDTALRFSAGGAIAPPYLSLISSPGSAPAPNSIPATAYLQNANNGQIAPETAFAYDLGVDRRLATSLSLSLDLYLTTLHDEFLPETFQNGTYSSPSGQNGGAPLPLYVTETQNLGHARYEGLEVVLAQTPLTGWGFQVQGSLQKAYPYDLPPGFYNTAAGPYTANLGVIPNVNFQPTGIGFNSVGNTTTGTPYAMGYGELNYRTARGNFYNAGIQYFGPNNGFNRPPFAVVSAGVRVQIRPGESLQLTGDNIFNAYGQPWYSYFAGTPVPLVNGQHGQSAGVLGVVPGGNYGPPNVRLQFTQELGSAAGTRP